MSEIINLRRVRKLKARETSEKQAAENRALYGRTKSERQQTDTEKRKAEIALDGHRLTSAGQPPETKQKTTDP